MYINVQYAIYVLLSDTPTVPEMLWVHLDQECWQEILAELRVMQAQKPDDYPRSRMGRECIDFWHVFSWSFFAKLEGSTVWFLAKIEPQRLPPFLRCTTSNTIASWSLKDLVPLNKKIPRSFQIWWAIDLPINPSYSGSHCYGRFVKGPLNHTSGYGQFAADDHHLLDGVQFVLSSNVLHLRRWRWCQCRHFRGVMQPKHPWWRLHFFFSSSVPREFHQFKAFRKKLAGRWFNPATALLRLSISVG